ncbi:MAG: hypothetical protein GX589_10875 [Deltaproteobacteria bacterium]|nr:hypothetical protein [Deltaproteobacteria bacterium]
MIAPKFKHSVVLAALVCVLATGLFYWFDLRKEVPPSVGREAGRMQDSEPKGEKRLGDWGEVKRVIHTPAQKKSSPHSEEKESPGAESSAAALKKTAPLVALRRPGEEQPLLEQGLKDGRQAGEGSSNSSARLLSEESASTGYLPLFSDEDLAQLERSGAKVESGSRRTGLIAGARSGLTAAPPPKIEQQSGSGEEDESNEDESSSSHVEFDPPRYTGQARGYTMLYLMQPEARATVERELETLLQSGLREVFLGVVSDGSFGEDYSYLVDVLQRLHAAERVTTLLLYLSNGPHQRLYATIPVSAGFNKIAPARFREDIKNDPATRQRFLEMVRRVRPLFQLNAGLDPRNKNIAVVMLEDNLRADSYQAMRELARSVLGNLVEFMRNPCENCGTGSDGDPVGDRIERHGTSQIWKLGRGDGLTLDGEGLMFPWEANGSGATPEQVMQAVRLSRNRRLSFFGLWRWERQGLSPGIMLHPAERRYEIPTPEQSQIEIEILRAGLSTLDTTPSNADTSDEEDS